MLVVTVVATAGTAASVRCTSCQSQCSNDPGVKALAAAGIPLLEQNTGRMVLMAS